MRAEKWYQRSIEQPDGTKSTTRDGQKRRSIRLLHSEISRCGPGTKGDVVMFEAKPAEKTRGVLIHQAVVTKAGSIKILEL